MPRLSPDNPTIAVEGSADFSKTTFNFDPNAMVVAIGGSLRYHGHAVGVPDYTVTLIWVGTVDLTKDPRYSRAPPAMDKHVSAVVRRA